MLLVFGVGTLPNLLAAQWVLAQSRRLSWPRQLRQALACLMLAFGLIGLARAAGLEAPAHVLAWCRSLVG